MRPTSRLATLTLLLLALQGADSAYGSGLLIFEQGTKSMGMASAFAAQADDPSTLFFNPGSISFFSEHESLVGMTVISVNSRFTSADRDPDGAAAGWRNDPVRAFPPHIFFIQPVSDEWSLGFAAYAPFGLATDWSDKSTFPGRFVSTEFSLATFDLSANVGYRLSRKLGVSLGFVARTSRFEHHRLSSKNDSIEPIDIKAKSDFEPGLGWNAGLFVRPTKRISFGLSYRSGIDVDHDGDVHLSTGTAGLSLRSDISYPELVIVGIAYRPHPRWVVEVDFSWTGWSSFEGMRIDVPRDPELSVQLMQGFTDSTAWRAGVQFTALRGWQIRGGVVVDQSPQPDRDLSPVLADADRLGLTLGAGFRLFDVSLMYLAFDERTSVDNRLGLDGTYAHNVWLAGLTLGFR